MNEKPQKLDGLIAAPFTPLQPDGSLNLDLIDRQAGELSHHGVRGAFVCGTTGEGFSLTSAERMQVAERWVKAAPRDLAVIVHVTGQMLPSGTLPDFEPQPPKKPQGQFAVKIVFDGDQSRFPIGAQGAAAIYTGGMHGGWAAMRRIGIRSYSWMNWLYPIPF